MSLIERVRSVIKHCRREITALYYACKAPQLTWPPRLLALLAIAYALSPVDLIPDFIPVLGYLDDLVILPTLIWLAVHVIPRLIMQQARRMADEQPLKLPKSVVGAVIIFFVWAILAALAVWLIFMR